MELSKICPNLFSNVLCHRSLSCMAKVLGKGNRQSCIKGSFPHNLMLKCHTSQDADNPIKRTNRILKKQMKEFFGALDGTLTEIPPYFPNHCDVLIIGGGIIGSSIAYWLQKRALRGLEIVVLEKDSSVGAVNYNTNPDEYSKCSTTLSAGGLRTQFSLPENIEMSMFGAEFLRNIADYLTVPGSEPPNVNFTPQGYLFLATERSARILEENAKVQKTLGAKNELLTARQLKSRYPWMNTEGIELGCHGLENEGWFDPWSLLMAFKNKATSLGTKYVTGTLESFDFKQETSLIMESIPQGDYFSINHANVRLPNGDKEKITFSQLIIAAGAQSGEVGLLANMGNGPYFLELPVPVEPRKRYVYCVHCPGGPGMAAPFVIDPTGMYFRREGFNDNYICGRSPDPSDEPSCDNLEVDHKFFEEEVWPVLAHRVPAFEALKVKSAWAGFYDYNTFDENAIVGPHPQYHNVYLATGFSGHGLQQAPAVGRAIMELMIDGYYKSIDLTRMQFERVFHNEQLRETNIV